VRDYHGYQTPNICDIGGQAVAGLAGYSVAVTVQTMTLSGLSDVLRVTVTAARGGQSMSLDGFRSNYGGVAPPP
jgi:MSHA pilin protein MshD